MRMTRAVESFHNRSQTSGGRSLAREWIVFAICLGLGGHLALGVILHAPDLWTVREAGLNGLWSGLGIYAAVQACRSLWWLLQGRGKARLDAGA